MEALTYTEIMKKYENKTLSGKLVIVNKYKNEYPHLKYLWISSTAKYLANINDVKMRRKYGDLILGLLLEH